MGMKQQDQTCDTCQTIATERNRFFTGKYMSTREFEDEQQYFLSRHRLHNRLLHGWGIVCGLQVDHHPDHRQQRDTDCAKRWVVVRAGIAIDCCGRELIVPRDIYYELPLPREPKAARPSAKENTRTRAGSPANGDDEVLSGRFLLGLRYKEQAIELVPALYSEGACDPKRQEANRVREGVDLVVRRADALRGCWKTSEGANTPCRDDCGDDQPGPTGTCLEPVCPCEHMLPLALITFDPKAPQAGFAIDLAGRTYLPPSPQHLTHIVDCNWTHGGEVTLSQLRYAMRGRLEVRFDRRLLEAAGEATGINQHTFVVQYYGVQEAVEVLLYDEHPPFVEDGCVAVLPIDPDKLRGRENIANNMLVVTLKCNFVLDCHRNPVDGDFLRAQFPTGDGVPGGVFESWFRVVPDGRAEEAK